MGRRAGLNGPKPRSYYQKHSKLIQRSWRNTNISLRTDKKWTLQAYKREAKRFWGYCHKNKRRMLCYVSFINYINLYWRSNSKIPKQGINFSRKILLLFKKCNIFLYLQLAQWSNSFLVIYSFSSWLNENRNQ